MARDGGDGTSRRRNPEAVAALLRLRMAAGLMWAARRNFEDAIAARRAERGAAWTFLSKWGRRPHLHKLVSLSVMMGHSNGTLPPVAPN